MSPKSSWGKVENEKMSKKAVVCKRRQFFAQGAVATQMNWHREGQWFLSFVRILCIRTLPFLHFAQKGNLLFVDYHEDA